jgi:hypothetical protein
MGIKDDLIGLSEFSFQRTRARVAGLTDEEWLWEPVAWSWTLREIHDEWAFDWLPTALMKGPPPVTTIAWRLGHLIDNYAGARNRPWLGLEPDAPMSTFTGSAASEVDRLDEAYAQWDKTLHDVDDAALDAKLGSIAGEYAEHTLASFVLHELDEVIHHGAEIGVLRDLYGARSVPVPAIDTVAAAASVGRWDRVVELCEGGADPNGSGFTPLHLAVAGGVGVAVRALLAAGADTTAVDPQYRQTPLQWAQWFHADEIAALLS